MKISIRSLAVASLFLANWANAQTIEEIKVLAHPLSEDGSSQSVSNLSGDALLEKVQGSLGETVANEPGVRSANFGAAVGRPVIHGLGGVRVKTTEDQIDTLDVSATSADHAVTVEPFIADEISILRGASTLLYGSGAIGGVVDVVTGRLPSELPEETISGRVEARFGDNEETETFVARLDGKSGEHFAWHIDAFDRSSDDYDIPGFVESEQQRASEAAGEEGEGDAGEEEEFGTLEGSFYDTTGGAIGFSLFGTKSRFGLSVSTIDSDYGLVGAHEEEEEGGEEAGEEEEGPGRIELEQTRVDLDAQTALANGPFSSVRFRAGVNNYEHIELEGNGEVGTVFDNDAWEARLELVHATENGFDGVLGVQANQRDFSALGEEAFVQPVDTDSVGIFWVGEKNLGKVDLETGVRIERVEHDPSEAASQSLDFTSVSASLGGVYRHDNGLRLSGLLDYSQRAPAIEELYSNGPHLATQSFEIGDESLDEESALGLTLTLDYATEKLHLRSSVYLTEFDDFIFLQATGEIEDGLPVLVYLQDDASFVGLDAELDWQLVELGGGPLTWQFQFDAVRARVDSGINRNLPRIPARRFATGLDWQNPAWAINLTYTNVAQQNDTAENELITDGYDDVSLRLARKFNWGDSSGQVFIRGRNLSDDEQRRHESFVKDFAPAPGRTVEIGVRFSF